MASGETVQDSRARGEEGHAMVTEDSLSSETVGERGIKLT